MKLKTYCQIRERQKSILVIKDKNKQALFSLQENRKFDLNHLKALKAKKYVEKITV
jgi:hypothetical protein